MNISLIATLLFIGLIAGILSGMIGIGGGVVIVPCLVYFVGLTQHQSQGTSLLMMLPPIGILAAINYFKSPHMQMDSKYLFFAGILAIAFIIGGHLGSKAAVTINQNSLRKVFGIIMLLISIKMIFYSK